VTDGRQSTADPHIGRLNERSLHAALKEWCRLPGDALETVVDGYVVDVVRDGLLIEVQTAGIGAIKAKLESLAQRHAVRVVYPIVSQKMIQTIAPDDGRVLRRRRSPARLVWANVFDELVYCPTLLDTPQLDMLAVRVAVTELRCDDGQGAWRRRRVSIRDTLLDEVLESRVFSSGGQLAELLPEDLTGAFTHREMATAMGIAMRTAQRASYCLRKLGLLRVVGRRGREMLVERAG